MRFQLTIATYGRLKISATSQFCMLSTGVAPYFLLYFSPVLTYGVDLRGLAERVPANTWFVFVSK